jgi:L-cysteine S-thiosulfotransferase
MKKIILLAALAVLAAPVLLARPATAQDKPKPNVETYFKTMFKKLPEGWESRIVQDETQRICSETRNSPTQAEFEKIKAREVATIEYPADGNVMGDWKKGEKIAQNGRGGQFSDEPGTERGGNCYACHQMATAEVSYGTLGPSLTGYGKTRKFDAAETKAAYAKIYNAQSVLPCSNMPRFGFHKFLSVEQIKDLTAYLMSPDSPVNK